MDVHASEKEQIESLKKWWKENGSSLITGALLGLSLIFGARAWMNWKDTQAENASNSYAVMQTALKQNDLEMVRNQASQLISQSSGSGYAVLAALVLAKLAVQDGELAAAQAQLEWALEHAKTPQLENIARSRLVRVLIDEKDYSQAAKVLAETTGVGEYQAIYAELEGDLAFAQGETASAAAAYRDALALLPATAPNVAYLRVKYENLAGKDAAAQ
ncbi:putative negative regulator of RcsB-dependent stress response [Thiogranum longum]|uniref:Ancillary SecYEG translocon subunit n=1 Tax=Thiogranum longum TaxID=1537524 RepID=A0A4R1HA97_9GAMM|nr:tetratricopeptide repeat protein [Thiogranum longum]TCK17481.1 putative negative regulator of RcsB-dependent stress response [Thiogranum longum]